MYYGNFYEFFAAVRNPIRQLNSMGIQGLLPVLKEIQSPIDLSQLSGESVAVDAYVWLHKGAFSCAFELATGKPTLKYVDYCMRKVNQLKQNRIWPIIVFDGGKLPMKKRTEVERHQIRTERMKKGKEMLEKGDKTKACEYFQTSIDITPEMAYEWIKVLRKEGVEYVVAPYEADAQLAYLSKQGIVSAVISEDSDLLTFGCKRVIYKLGADGKGTEIKLENLGNIKGMEFWDHSRFRQMCILAGCDYLKSPPGIGVKTAMKNLYKCDAYSVLNY
jgi:exonuclease-1